MRTSLVSVMRVLVPCLLGLTACDRPDPAPEAATSSPPTGAKPAAPAGDEPAAPAPAPAPAPSQPDPVPVPSAADDGPPEPTSRAPSTASRDAGCRSDADCESGELCVGEGLEGCGGAPGRCEANVMCTRDAVAYCGCDGQTFRASSRCPGREYAYAGECRAKKGQTGDTCLDGIDCASGICEGQGCGPKKPGRCAAPDRACTTDAVPYCGCDHQTFRSSSKCPGRRYRNQGECHR